MTEPIYSDPRVSVRQTKGRLQWNLPAASNGISMNPQAGRSGRADSTAIRAEDPLYPNTPYLSPSVIIASLSKDEMPPAWKERKKRSEKNGRLLQLRPVYLDIC